MCHFHLFSPVADLLDTSFGTTTQTLAWGCRDLYIQCTSKDFEGLAPVDVAQGGCILSCSQFEKCAGRELSKKWKERCGCQHLKYTICGPCGVLAVVPCAITALLACTSTAQLPGA